MTSLSLIGGDQWGSVEIQAICPQECEGLILNNATARPTMSASPIGTALVDTILPLTQDNSKTTNSEQNRFGEAVLKSACQKMRHTIRCS